MSLQWSEDLRVGHGEIDEQHQELFSRFNDFLEACQNRQGREKLDELFEFLMAYVVLHFHAEEELMKDTHYPDRAKHLEQHQEFRDRIGKLRQELRKAGPTVEVLVHTNKALLFWLTTHIKEVDRQLGPFLNRHLAKPGPESS